MAGHNAPTKLDLLLIEPDREALESMLREIPAQTRFLTVQSTTEADRLLSHATVRLLICADDLPGESGLMFLARTRQQWPEMRRILLAPALDPDLFFHAMREVQLFHFLDKPIHPGALARAIHQCLHPAPAVPHSPPRAESPAVVSGHPEPQKTGLAGGMLLGLLLCAVTLGPMTLLLLAYFLKTLAGIDLLPGTHLRDFFP